MYWLLRYAQHARDINIHKLHPLPEQNRLGPLCQFSDAQWNTPFSVRSFDGDEAVIMTAGLRPLPCRDVNIT